MQPRENALRIIRFDCPERVVTSYPVHDTYYVGCAHEGYEGGGHHLPVGSKWTDIWGAVWHREHEGVMGFPRGFPLADLPTALPTYKWPDPDDERICACIYRMAEDWDGDQTFLMGWNRDTLWEKSYMLVGMADLMCYSYTDPQAVGDLLHGIMDFQLGMARHYLKVGVEFIGMSDDLGTQNGLLLSSEIIHEFLLPEYRRLFALYKRHGVLVDFHSCGHITPVLDVFMELGADVLNPVQATANDLDEVRRITQGRMALKGGVRSHVVMDGPPEAIRAEVAERIWQLGRDGGYFCRPDQGLPWPPEHFQALEDAVEELGAYPLRVPSHERGDE